MLENAFAALSATNKQKTKKKSEPKVIPPIIITPKLSTPLPVRTNERWADISEDDYDYADPITETIEADHSSSDEDSVLAEDEEDDDATAEVDEVMIAVESYKKDVVHEVKPISKKELQQKELEAMSAAFAELGIPVDTPQSSPTVTPNDTRERKRKSKKKDKSQTDATNKPSAGTTPKSGGTESGIAKSCNTSNASEEAANNTTPQLSREDVLKHLRNNPKSKIKKNPAVVVTQLASVRAEAKKKAEGRKAKAKKNDIPQYQTSGSSRKS